MLYIILVYTGATSSASSIKFSYMELIHSLGVSGLYTGVLSTWLRDVPFSIIYFSMYSQCKSRLIDTTTQQCNNDKLMPFISGAIAGTSAAALTTPLDVIKTRVHASAVRAPVGQFWNNERQLITHKVRSLYHTEGMSALFRGIVPRCLIISPLFGITMTCYEKLQDAFH